MKTTQLSLPGSETKSGLRSSILALTVILSAVSTGLTQESFSSDLSTNAALPKNQLVATIPLGFNVFPRAVVVSPDSQTIYVTSSSDSGGLVSVIDSHSNTVTGTIPVGGGLLDGLAITPDGSTLYVGNAGSVPGTTSVVVISTATKTVTANIELSAPDGLAVNPSGTTVYVTDPANKAISIIQTATNKLIPDAINVGDVPEQIAVSPNGKLAYVSTTNNVVSAIDLVAKQVIATIPFKNRNGVPVSLSFTPDGQRLYICKHQVVRVADTSTNKIIGKSVMPVAGREMNVGQTAITPDGKFLYQPFAGANTIVMLDTGTNQAVGNQVSVKSPVAIAVASTNTLAYAVGTYPSGNGDEGAVYVIDISPK